MKKLNVCVLKQQSTPTRSSDRIEFFSKSVPFGTFFHSSLFIFQEIVSLSIFRFQQVEQDCLNNGDDEGNMKFMLLRSDILFNEIGKLAHREGSSGRGEVSWVL